MNQLDIGQIAADNAKQPTQRTNTKRYWEDRNIKRTFYISRDLMEQMKLLRDLTGQSLSSQVNTALEAYVKRKIKAATKAQSDEEIETGE